MTVFFNNQAGFTPPIVYPLQLKTAEEKLAYLEKKYFELWTSLNCEIPTELLNRICFYMTNDSLKNFAISCKRFYSIAQEERDHREAKKIGTASIKQFQQICNRIMERSNLQCSIRKLDLSDCSFSDSELSYITQFGKNLQRLRLGSSSALRYDEIKIISESCSKVKELILEKDAASDCNLKLFFKEKNPIRKLIIDEPATHLTEEGLISITPFASNLNCFFINDVNFISSTLLTSFVKNCTQLVEILISKTPGIDDHFFFVLRHLTQLKYLSLYDISQFSDLGLNTLGEATLNLNELLLHGNDCTISEEALIAFLKKNPQLKKIFFHFNCPITDRTLKVLSDTCFSLEVLYFNDSRQLTDDGIEYFVSKCKILTELMLGQSFLLSDRSLCAIAQYCPNLQTLHFQSASHISIEGLTHLSAKCTRLIALDLCASSLTEKDFCILPKLFPTLVNLDVSLNAHFTNDALITLLINCKNLNIVYHSLVLEELNLKSLKDLNPNVKLEYVAN